MNILAIESSSIVCGVALYINNELIEIDEIIKPRVHGERLPVIVNNILINQSLLAQELDGIAVSSGPGSYTGLRIGMSLAKGIAMAARIPIIPVPTLEAMNREIEQDGIYWICLHSHKNVVFIQKFDSGLPISDAKCITLDSENYYPMFGFNLESICKSSSYKIAKLTAKNVGDLAIENFENWAEFNLTQVTPNYISNINIDINIK